MIFGGLFLLFSVSATLKVCIYIIAHKKFMSRVISFQSLQLFTNKQNLVITRLCL